MDNKPEIPNDLGVIRIADEVVSTVAGLAAVEVEGVAAMSGGWVPIWWKDWARRTWVKV